MPLIAIYNPACGNREAKTLFESEVVPLLQASNISIDKVVSTERPGHAGTALVEFLESAQGEVTVVLCSGDGTLHEIVNAVFSTPRHEGLLSGASMQLHFVLVPCGTANALYSSFFPPSNLQLDAQYRFQSVQSFINGTRVVPLSLAMSSLSGPLFSKQNRSQKIISTVVVSTSLHASILYDSENLRRELPGIERFKVAAQKNITRWYRSSLKLLPVEPVGVVQMFNPSTNGFIPHPDSHPNDPIVELEGPFAYFLSTVNVDRLEPTFRITPLAHELPPTQASLDIVIIRPLRDPAIPVDSPEARMAFVDKFSAILKGAYENGSHIRLRYTVDGQVGFEGSGPIVVEYIRCGGWEWIPDDTDSTAHILCTDGEIFDIEKGGTAECIATSPTDCIFMLHI